MTQSQFPVAAPFAPVSIPAPPAHFAGREAELAALAEALTTGDAPQAIVGVGGVGKTALAAQLAAQFAHDFPGGVFWADLPAHGGDPLPVLGAWARLCGQDVSALYDPQARARAVREMLADRVAERGRVLVVLDDVRGGWLQGVRVLASARPPDAPLLLTARQARAAQALQASVTRIEALSPDEARRLLAELTDDALSGDAAARVVGRCGRLPLALELAAAAAVHREAAWLLDALDGARRQGAGVRPVFDVGYRALADRYPGTARAFRCLGAFAPAPVAPARLAGVLAEAGSQVAPVEVEAADGHLRRLARWALVRRATGEERPRPPTSNLQPPTSNLQSPTSNLQPRYSLHPLLHEYAAALLEEAGEGPVTRAAHAAHYLAYAEAHDRPAPADYDALEAERPNLLAGVDCAFREERWAQVRRFARALCDPADGYLHARGYWGELRARLRQALRAAQAEGRDMDAVDFIRHLALVAQNLGDGAGARRLYRESLDIAEEVGDWTGIAAALAHLADLATAEGDRAEAYNLYRQSLDVLEELEAGQRVGPIYHRLGDLAFRQGEQAEAQRLYRRSLDIAEGVGDRARAVKLMHQLGMLAQRAGDYAEARRLYRESLDRAKELGRRADMAITLHELGNLASMVEAFSEARRLYQRSLDIAEELGDRAGVAATLHQLGMVAQKAGDYAEAHRLYRHSLQIERELGNRAGVAKSLHGLGSLAVVAGDYAGARRLYRQSLDLAEEVGDRATIASTLGQLGNLAQLTGEQAEARRLYGRSLAMARELGDRVIVAIALHQLGNLAYLAGEQPEARRLYRQSLDIVEELGDRAGIASTLGQLANLAQAEGDLVRAERLYRRNLTICQEMGDALTERVTLLNLALLYEDQGRLADAAPLLERAVHIDERLGLPNLEQDRSVLNRVRLQMAPGCVGWIVRRVAAFGRALRQLRRGNLAL